MECSGAFFNFSRQERRYPEGRAGTIAIRNGNPHDRQPWEWRCGFYPGSEPLSIANGRESLATPLGLTRSPKSARSSANRNEHVSYLTRQPPLVSLDCTRVRLAIELKSKTRSTLHRISLPVQRFALRCHRELSNSSGADENAQSVKSDPNYRSDAACDGTIGWCAFFKWSSS